MSAAPILAALEALPKAHALASGQMVASCPGPDHRRGDVNPGLTWRVERDGRVLLRCHAGCATEAIVAAMGYTMADLFPLTNGAAAPARPAKPPRSRSPERRWTAYDVEGGTWVHIRRGDVRFWEPAGVRLNRLRPYGSEDLGDGPTVVAEGQPAADAMRALGIQAIATFGTSYKPDREALEHLSNREFILLPDADSDPAKGRAHMLDIGDRLAGVGGSLRWVEPPEDVFDGWDAADADEATIRGLIAEAGPLPPRAGPTPRLRLLERYGARTLSTVSTDPPRPRLFGRYVDDGHTILYGKGGVGKGMVLANDIGRIVVAGGRVLIVDYEDHPDEWARRIAAMHGVAVLADVLIVSPTNPQVWREPTGSLWDIAPVLRELADEFHATWTVVDSIVPGCFGHDPNAAGIPQDYGRGIAVIGRPAISIGQVNRAGDLRYPFGSALWRYQARGTWSIEHAPGSAPGHQVLLTDTKANNHAKAERTLAIVTYKDDMPGEIWEKPYSLALADQIAVVLIGGPMTPSEITDELNVEVEDDAQKVKANSVRVALRRGLTGPEKRFTVTGMGKAAKYALASGSGGRE